MQSNASVSYEVKLLLDFLKQDDGETYITLLGDDFKSPNADVEHFFKQSAIASTRLRQSASYLVFLKNDFVGFFTLAIKTVQVRYDILSGKERNKLERFSKLDEEKSVYVLPAILLAQFSRNFDEHTQTLSGDTLMAIAKKHIFDIQDKIGGSLIFLECEPIQVLVDFYKRHGFKELQETRISNAKKELLQLYMIR